MTRNLLSGHGRLLQTMSLVLVTVMFTGCCSMPDLKKCCKKKGFIKPMDVMYVFNIPESQADCNTIDVDYEFVDLEEEDKEREGGAGIVDRDGGAGIVERDPRDGGSGIVDRNSGDLVFKYCDFDPCDPDTQTLIEGVYIDLEKSHANGYVIATNKCQSKDGAQ
jgi:hypothetical protein